jgi:hypothetical protein
MPQDAVSRLRELCIRMGDGATLNGLLFAALVKILPELKDKDWDRKCVRYIHLFLRSMVTPEGDCEGRIVVAGGQESDTAGHASSSSCWRGRGITLQRLVEAVTAVEAEARHTFLPR